MSSIGLFTSMLTYHSGQIYTIRATSKRTPNPSVMALHQPTLPSKHQLDVHGLKFDVTRSAQAGTYAFGF